MKKLFFRILLLMPMIFEIMFLRELIGDDYFSEIEYLKTTSSLILFASFGSGTGYIRLYFKQKNDYVRPYFIVGSALIVIVSLIWQNYSVSVLGLIFFAHKVLEKGFEAKGYVYRIYLVKSISIITFLLLLIFIEINPVLLLLLSYATPIVIYAKYIQDYLTKKKGPAQNMFVIYIQLIKAGWKYQALTFFLIALNYFDRLSFRNTIMEPDYAMGYNIVLSIGVLYSIVVLKNTKFIGDKHESINWSMLQTLLKEGCLYMTLILTIVALGIIIVNTYFNYDLSLIVIILSLGMATFFLSTTISSMLFYIDGVNRLVFMAIGLIFVKYLTYNLANSYYASLIITSFLLMVFSFYTLYLIKKTII